jgi:hypothetical protein
LALLQIQPTNLRVPLKLCWPEIHVNKNRHLRSTIGTNVAVNPSKQSGAKN